VKICYMKCVCTSANKALVKKLQSEGYEIKDIRKKFEWRIEARQYSAKLPFLVVDGEVTEI